MTSIESTVRAVAASDPRLRWSICVRATSGAVLAGHQGSQRLATASVGKLLLLGEVARRCVDVPAYADRLLGRHDVDPVGDSGLLQHLRVQRLSVHDLAVLVASVSDNLATNILLAEVGLASVDELGRELGLRATTLLDIVRDERRREHAPTLSFGNADELSRLLADLVSGELISPAVSAQLRAWLGAGVDLSLVGSAFGLDPLAHGPADGVLSLVNKTGSDRGIRADVGAVTGPGGQLAYAVIVNWDDADAALLDVALSAMQNLGAELRRAITI